MILKVIAMALTLPLIGPAPISQIEIKQEIKTMSEVETKAQEARDIIDNLISEFEARIQLGRSA